jgi:hypothetical protein
MIFHTSKGLGTLFNSGGLNMRIYGDLSGHKLCWYCQENPPCRNRHVVVHMYGNLREQPPERKPLNISLGPDVLTSVGETVTGNVFNHVFDTHSPQLEYKQTQIGIPRCKRCANIHAYRSGFAILLASIPVIVLLNLSVSFYVAERFSNLPLLLMLTLFLLVPAFVVGRWVGSFISTKLFSHIREKSDYFGHPVIEAHVNSGWFFGEQPPQEARSD